jgi:hypothetical protein
MLQSHEQKGRCPRPNSRPSGTTTIYFISSYTEKRIKLNLKLKFDEATSVKLIRTMEMLSKLDSTMYEAQRQGRISFYMPNHGETAAQLGSAHALDPKDLVFGKYIIINQQPGTTEKFKNKSKFKRNTEKPV